MSGLTELLLLFRDQDREGLLLGRFICECEPVSQSLAGDVRAKSDDFLIDGE